MNRPSEQLIRDYLNRLSLAAKARLEPGDRHALLDHTRARIDAECGGAAHPTAEQVRRTLAGLGDPIALAENEWSRIAARKAWSEEAGTPRGTVLPGARSGEAGACAGSQEAGADGQDEKEARQDAGSRQHGDAAVGRANGSPRQVWPPPATPVIARQPFLPPVVIPPATANAQVSSAPPATRTSSPASPPAVSVSHPDPSANPAPSVQPAPSAQPAPSVQPAPSGHPALSVQAVPAVRLVPANGPVVVGEAARQAEPVAVRSTAWAGPPVSPNDVPPQSPAPANGAAHAASLSSENPADRPRPARPTSPTAPRGLPPARGVPAPRGVPPAHEPSASGNEPAPPGGAGRGEGGSAGSNGTSSRPPAPRPAPGSGSPSRAGGTASGPGTPQAPPRSAGEAGDEHQPAIEFSINPADLEAQPSRAAAIGDAALRRLRGLGPALLTIARRDRRETISLLLLGIGGAIYPPIWLIGALIAVSSKKWDLRDKWLGLVLPVLVVVMGAVLEVTFGAHFSAYWRYLVEAWVAASRLSRAAAVLGAIYLLWRLYKHGGTRTERLPPWSPQRRPGR